MVLIEWMKEMVLIVRMKKMVLRVNEGDGSGHV